MQRKRGYTPLTRALVGPARSDLGSNFLRGGVPAELSRLGALTALLLDGNFLSGPLPALPAALATLSLEGNALDGAAPLPAAACAAACESADAFACPLAASLTAPCAATCAAPAGCRAACAAPTAAAVAAAGQASFCAGAETACFECTSALFDFYVESRTAAQLPPASDARQLGACLNAQLLPFLAAGASPAALSRSRGCAFQRRLALPTFTCPVRPAVAAWAAAVAPCVRTEDVCDACSATMIGVLRAAGLDVPPLGLTFSSEHYQLVANCLAQHALDVAAAGVSPAIFAAGFAICTGPSPEWYAWMQNRTAASAAAAVAAGGSGGSGRSDDAALAGGLGGGLGGAAALGGVVAAVAAVRRRRRRAAGWGSGSKGAADAAGYESNGALALAAPARLLRPDEVTLYNLLGAGAFASVYRGDWRGAPVAVKCFPALLPSLLPSASSTASFPADAQLGGSAASRSGSSAGGTLNARERAGLLGELRVLSALRHPNVCAVYGAVARPPMLVIELAPAGSLKELLARPATSLAALPWRARIGTIGVGVACGVEYLHAQSPPVIHRDLKSANVVLAAELVPKLCDFGLSRVHRCLAGGGAAARMRTADGGRADADAERIGTPRYMAPELVLGAPITRPEAIDAYGLGIVLHDLAHLGLGASGSAGDAAPAQQADGADASAPSMDSAVPTVTVLLARMWSAFKIEIAAECPAPLADLIRQLLAPEPAARPDSAAVRAALLGMAPLADAW